MKNIINTLDYDYLYKSNEEVAKIWRDTELKNTDWIVPITDHPKHALYITYRQSLRDWPSTPDFPNTKPVLE